MSLQSATLSSAIVTGSAGFIGSALAQALLRGNTHVIAIDNFDTFYDPAVKRKRVARIGQSATTRQFEFHPLDILDAKALADVMIQRQPEIVFHLAAKPGVRPSMLNPGAYETANVTGLVNVLEACRASGCRNVVFASSSSVYGNNRKTPFAETDSVDDPISPYAATKRAGEIICQTYAHSFGLRIAAVRLFTVFGPGQRPDLAIAKFMRQIQSGEAIEMFGDGSTSRDYTYVDDAVGGLVAAGNRLMQGSNDGAIDGGFFRIWNIGSDRPLALREMIAAIERVTSKRAKIEHRSMQVGDVERTWADLTRSRAELNYQPTTAFEDGLWAQWQDVQREDRGESGGKQLPEITVISPSKHALTDGS